MRCAAVILQFLLAGAMALPGAGGPIRAVVLTGQTDLPHHDWRETTPYLRAALERTGRFEVRVIEEANGLTADTLKACDVVIVNYNGPRWSGATEKAVEEFVRSGGGMFSFHGVSYGEFFGMVFAKRWQASPAGDRGWESWADMLGATWKPENIGHSRRHAFTVKWTDREHPISCGLDETFLANDELYHKLDLKPPAKVLATAYSEPSLGGTGKDEPMLWTVEYGQGRTVHTPLGHDLAALCQPGVLAAFARSVEWAATGAVSLGATVPPPGAPDKDAVRVLAVTGGHAYPAAFYSLFEGYPNITWDHADSPAKAFGKPIVDRYDTVVLHDMHNEIGEPERANLKAFVEAGKGVVSIHHAIVDYTAWPWWHEEVTGGKYFEKAVEGHAASAFREGVDMLVTPVAQAARHPVLRGVGPLPLHDEVYRGMWQSPKITVLMETEHRDNDRPVVYLGPHPRARVVYIQPGHSAATMRHPGYRKLVRNAILWTAGRAN